MNLRNIASALLLTLAWSSHADQDLPFNVEAITAFDEPWAMAFLPDERMLVTEKKGRLLIVDSEGNKLAVSGLPDVGYGGQGGMGDVALHPDFCQRDDLHCYVESATTALAALQLAEGRSMSTLDGQHC